MELYCKKFEELTVEELYRILQKRNAVFMMEQNVHYLDLDDLDQKALHIWLEDEDGLEAYLRVMDRGAESQYVSIGRVLAVKRRQGLATRLMQAAIAAAEKTFHADKIYLEAQLYARGLYDKLGFQQISEPFPIDGIPHIKMLLDCGKQ